MPGEAWELSLTSERRPSRSAFAMVVTGVSHMVFRVPLCQVGPGNTLLGLGSVAGVGRSTTRAERQQIGAEQGTAQWGRQIEEKSTGVA